MTKLTKKQQELTLTGIEAAQRAIGRRIRATMALCNMSADDIKQEACLAACLAARSFKPPGKFDDYAATAAINKIRYHIRNVPDVKVRNISMTVARDIVEKQQDDYLIGAREKLEGLLESLPKRQKEVLTHFLEGMNNCEIGRKMGINEATVRIHYKRAVAKLRLQSCRSIDGDAPVS